MPRPFMRRMNDLQPENVINIEGTLSKDPVTLSPCQEECGKRVARTIRLEQEAYLDDHPEVIAMLKLFMKNAAHGMKRSSMLLDTAHYFTRPKSVLDQEIRDFLNLVSDESYIAKEAKHDYEHQNLEYDLFNIILKHYPSELEEVPSASAETHFTTSSSFLSACTSSTTIPTPEPIPMPEPTTSEIFFTMISNTVDKAIYSRVTEDALKYDTAYIELMDAVERAMEITVTEIRQDIAVLFNNAFHRFDLIIREKEKIAAAIAWEKRMRKKLKRSLRLQKNFKGYETPPTPKSEISSHESYKIAPQKPCACHPQWTYNRYPKDRFGIYLPRLNEFKKGNITATPTYSTHSINGSNELENAITDKNKQ